MKWMRLEAVRYRYNKSPIRSDYFRRFQTGRRNLGPGSDSRVAASAARNSESEFDSAAVAVSITAISAPQRALTLAQLLQRRDRPLLGRFFITACACGATE